MRRDEEPPAGTSSGDFLPGFPRLAAVACGSLLVIVALRFGRPPGPAGGGVPDRRCAAAGPAAVPPPAANSCFVPDLTGLPDASSYRLEIVDQTGRPVRQGTIARAQDGDRVPGLTAGPYFVRVYLPAGELLREYGLEIR